MPIFLKQKRQDLLCISSIHIFQQMSLISTKATTRIYGHPVSQPSRAVLWAAAIKKLDFDFKDINPMLGETNTSYYMKKFPSGAIPGLEVRNDGTALSGADVDEDPHPSVFRLSEGAAILCYLADANGWSDLYPTNLSEGASGSLEALQRRAKVNQWLMWKEDGLRFATTEVFHSAAKERIKQKAKDTAIGKVVTAVADAVTRNPTEEEIKAEEEEKKKKEKEIKQKWKDAMLTMTYGGLKHHAYIAGDTLSIADIALYCEIDQIHYAGLYDFREWPEVYAWILRMQQAPEHDAIRAPLFKIIAELGFPDQK